MSRGDRREAIFGDEADRRHFLGRLSPACAKAGWPVHALCLVPNPFHLVVETPRGDLVAGMKWFLGTYTSRFNRRPKRFGHLFSGRYKALVVEGSGQFRDALLERLAGQTGEPHGGAERQETAAGVAEGIVGEELRRRGWTEAERASRRTGDAGKATRARRLRKERTMTLKWIAQRWRMGSASLVTHALRQGRK